MNQERHSHSGAHLLDIESPTSDEHSRTRGEQLDLSLTPQDRWQLFENGPDAMLACDSAGRIVDVNTRCLQVLRYSREELIGAKVEILVPNQFRHSHESQRDQYLATPSPRPMNTGRDLFGLRKDGSELPIDVDLGPVECEGRRVVPSVIRDRSERILCAQQLQDEAEFERTISRVSAILINLPADLIADKESPPIDSNV